MLKTIVTVFCIFLTAAAFAQTKKTYVVRAGKVPLSVLPVEAVYSRPQFTKGLVYFKNGATSGQKLNYNLALDEMHFINATNDTLAIAAPEMVEYVIIDTTAFFFDESYYEVIHTSGENKLAIKQFLIQTPYQTKNGYEVSSSVASLSDYSSTSYKGQIAKLEMKKDVEMEKKYMLFISDRFNHFFPADKKTFYKIFPEKKAALDTYLHDNDIKFRDKNELIKLLNICTAP